MDTKTRAWAAGATSMAPAIRVVPKTLRTVRAICMVRTLAACLRLSGVAFKPGLRGWLAY